MNFHYAELERRFNNLLVTGTIAATDYEQARFRVKLDVDTQTGDDVLTGWLPWPCEISNNFIRWRPLRVGAQVLLACPHGDPQHAILVQMLYNQAFTPPSLAPELDIVKFDDGSIHEYHSGTKTHTVTSAGDMNFHATGNVKIQADGQLCQLSCANDIDINAGGNLTITAGGSHTLQAASHDVTGPTTINDDTTINAATTINASATINGNTTMAGGLSQSGGAMTSNGVAVDNHVHGGVSSGPAKTGEPE